MSAGDDNGTVLWMAQAIASGLTAEEILEEARELDIIPETAKLNTIGRDRSLELRSRCRARLRARRIAS